MDLPDVKDLSAAPLWLAITFLAVAVLTPVLTGLLPKFNDRRRRKHHRHRDDEHEHDEHEHREHHDYETPALGRAVTGAAEMLDEAIDDLRTQRDREIAQSARLQRALDNARAESARKDVTIARLEAQLDVYRNQPGDRGGQP